MKNVRRATLALVAVAVAAVAVVGGGTAASQQAKTVTIGWAYDGVGAMAAVRRPRARYREGAHQGSEQDQRDEAASHHVQHAGQQAGDRQGVCREARRARAPTSS